ncbi:TMEM175 family protein [Lacticaseibacillus pabuli]|uniref:TMEM175 family protein n=1 Tax=Lacticaseibacillus pabuli TaxID=3025672 RepID=A0ABY7WUD7_9LACO|nr:TMEM175 family protein [Lacticaseibacillus sp. KACC 23028]WDF82611.1 TMEM175 family protein [Lacticaseibacillus sp. KACC 23028]
MSKDRLNAISDGVFAILLTILILEFKPETIRPGTLGMNLVHQWPLMVMYLLSYFYVGTSWLFHHDYFQYVERTNRTLNILNLVVLFAVTLINYAMVLVIEALTNGNNADIRVAFIAYDLVAIFISAAFLILYRYLERHPELNALKGIKTHYNRIRMDPARSVAIYVLSIVASFFSVVAAGLLLIAGVIFHFAANLRFSKVVHTGFVQKHKIKEGHEEI